MHVDGRQNGSRVYLPRACHVKYVPHSVVKTVCTLPKTALGTAASASSTATHLMAVSILKPRHTDQPQRPTLCQFNDQRSSYRVDAGCAAHHAADIRPSSQFRDRI